MSPRGGRSFRFFCANPRNRKCEDIFVYRGVDGGRTYGPEGRCCLFLTGPGSPAVPDEVMFMRSSKVAIASLRVEKRERKEGEEGDGKRKRWT